MSSSEGGRRIKVEVRGLLKTRRRHMLMFISEKMNKVRDLGIKLKYLCDDIKETDEIKIYYDKFLLPDNECINIIETGEQIIAYINASKIDVESEEGKDDTENKMTTVVKPPYSFTALISMSILQSPEKRLTPSGICEFIMDRFPYYKEKFPQWQKTISAYLSKDDRFIKIPRELGNPERANFWTMRDTTDAVSTDENPDDEYESLLAPANKKPERKKRRRELTLDTNSNYNDEEDHYQEDDADQSAHCLEEDKSSRVEEEGENPEKDLRVDDPIPEEQAGPSTPKENTDDSFIRSLRAILDDSDSDSD